MNAPAADTSAHATTGRRNGSLAVRFSSVIHANDAHRNTSTPADRIRLDRSGSELTTAPNLRTEQGRRQWRRD